MNQNNFIINTNALQKLSKLSQSSPFLADTYYYNDNDNSKTSEIEYGLDFIINHFDPTILYFPRTIMTKKLGYQKEVYSKSEALQYFQQSNYIDCRINSFRYSNPDLIFIDIDRNDFKDYKSFEKALQNTLKNIKEKLNEYPTILFTGGGYHIYQPVYCPTALENTEFKEFERPSEQFLRFAKGYLSNHKADKQNNPSFRSCLLRIPGSINSKYNTKVTIIKRWNGYRPPIPTDLLIEFRRYLIQKKIDQEKQRQKIFVERSKNKFVGSSNYYNWIENLTQTPIEDFRKLVVDLILAPYLINIRKISYQESYTIIKDWLDKCNELERLDNERNFEYRIKYELKNAINKQIGPMSKEKIKTDSNYSKLYIMLKQKGILK